MADIGDKNGKICCYLPEYNRQTTGHLAHVYDLLAQVAGRRDIFLVVTRSCEETPPEFAHLFYASKFPLKPIRMLETFVVFLTARLRGYKTFYVHYSLWNALLASMVTSVLGGTVHQWHCHCGDLKAPSNGHARPWFAGTLHPWVKKTSLRLSDSVVVASPSVARWYQRRFGLADEKLVVMPPFVSAERFVTGARANGRKKRVLFVHTLSKEKGAHHLLRIIPRILESLPETQFPVAGDGRYRDEIGKLPNVTMLGAVPNVQVPRLYAESDLIILPSEEEGVPHVLLEAMAMGVPFVATDVGGVADLVGESLKDTLVSPGDIDAFVERSVEILTNEKLAADLSRRCLARASDFTLENAADRFLEKIR